MYDSSLVMMTSNKRQLLPKLSLFSSSSSSPARQHSKWPRPSYNDSPRNLIERRLPMTHARRPAVNVYQAAKSDREYLKRRLLWISCYIKKSIRTSLRKVLGGCWQSRARASIQSALLLDSSRSLHGLSYFTLFQNTIWKIWCCLLWNSNITA